jgi:hypothetical protein
MLAIIVVIPGMNNKCGNPVQRKQQQCGKEIVSTILQSLGNIAGISASRNTSSCVQL